VVECVLAEATNGRRSAVVGLQVATRNLAKAIAEEEGGDPKVIERKLSQGMRR
jgi:hypothetical protein